MNGVSYNEGKNGIMAHHEESRNDEDPVLLHISNLVLQSSHHISLQNSFGALPLSTPLMSQLTCSQVHSSGQNSAFQSLDDYCCGLDINIIFKLWLQL